LSIGYWLLSIGYWLLSIGYWLLPLVYWLSRFVYGVASRHFVVLDSPPFSNLRTKMDATLGFSVAPSHEDYLYLRTTAKAQGLFSEPR
jgi:hypothetical protein